MNAVRTSRRVALIAALLAIPIGIWGIHLVGQQDRLAGIATASAAAATHGCNLDGVSIGQLVSQVRNESTIGWTESGNDVAEGFAGGCANPAASAHPAS